jgi:hypothetical protein
VKAFCGAMLIGAACWLVACTDPGCIRNSECGTGYVCLGQACVVETDGGPSGSEDDAGTE